MVIAPLLVVKVNWACTAAGETNNSELKKAVTAAFTWEYSCRIPTQVKRNESK